MKDMKNIKQKYIPKFTFEDVNPFNKGGESIIYPYKKQKVAKIFREDRVDYDLKVAILNKILQKKETLEGTDEKYKFIIPQKLLLESKTQKILGYTMEKLTVNQL